MQFSVAQTLFSENIGTPSSTTTIANNAFQNNGLLTYSNGSQTNAADIRKTNSSSEYSNASAGGNVFFTSTSGSYGFSIESINATNYSSLTLDYGYRKEAASVHANFSVDYWNGTSWIVLANSAATLFNESSSATAKWYLAKTLTLPNDAQINGLKIRFVKTGTTAIRIDDIILTGTEQVAPTVINSIVTSITNNSATFGGNVTATGGSAITSTGTVYAVTSINNNPIIGEASVITLNTPTPNSGTGTFSNSSGALLLSNVEYSYNVFAIKNGGAVGYGTVATFYTLATIPTAPSISNVTVNTLTITIGADANSNTTTYSLFETTTNSYVQSNGSLGGTAVYKTAAAWGNMIVLGLTPSTTYTFQTTAKNGANVTTTASVTTSGTTLLPNSILSDIVFNSDSSTSDNTNINYANYQATSITSTVNSVGVMGFHLRDGGAGHNDADNLGTELKAISFDVTNGANIRSARLFVGNSPKGISVPVVNGVLTFTGLTDIIAADDSQLAINLRVTFNTTVTDNEQMQFKIATVTANMNSSQFAMVNGGGASSSVAGDINRIEVVASKLGFTQQPPNSLYVGTIMTLNPTVAAKDEFENRDLDNTDIITLTLSGNSNIPITATAVDGIAIFNYYLFDFLPAGASYTLTASSNNLNSTTSNSFEVMATPIINLSNIPIPNCATTCNLVSNGGFEEYSQLPGNDNPIDYACGWYTARFHSKYFHSNPATNPNYQIPCNFYGNQTCNVDIGDGYAGIFYFSSGDLTNVVSSMMVSRLSSPLVAGQSYQLSIDVSLAEGLSHFSKAVQAYLSPNIIPIPTNSAQVAIDNPQMLFGNSTTSTISNGWETLTFTFTSSDGGEEYIYIGAFQNVVSQPNTLAIDPSCNYTTQPIGVINASFYYIDNVSLTPLDGVFDLPENICNTANLSNLSSFLSNAPANGVFTGPGIVENSGNYSFDAAVAGAGTHTISYSYNNSLGCLVTISDDITVVTDGIIAEFENLNNLVLCENVTPPVLSTTSDNGITGSWSPSTINTMTSGDYTFTSDSGQCSSSRIFTVTIINSLVAEDDDFSATPINLLTGGTTPSVYTNDTLNGNTLINTAVTSIILSTTPSMSTLPTIDSEGIITIPNDYPSGTYIIEYQLADSVCSNNFDTANVTVFVLPRITNCAKVYLTDLCYNDSQSQTTPLTIFNNENNGDANSTCDYALIGDVACNSSNVTIELITPLINGCTINTNGTINIPAGIMPFYAESYYQLRSIEYPTVVSDTFRVSYGINERVYPAYTIIYLHTGSAPYEVYDNGSANILYSPSMSKINPNTDGNCSLINAEIGSLSTPNTVTVTETTNPENPFYRIDSQTGEIVFRTPYGNSNPPPAPTLPSQSYNLTYEMCINNTGALTFCENGSVVIHYYYTNFRTGVSIEEKNDVLVYPNPSSDGMFTLLFNQEIKDVTVEVYNLLGQIVKQDTIQNGTEYQLNLSEAVTGNYILKINDGSQQIVKRITLNRK